MRGEMSFYTVIVILLASAWVWTAKADEVSESVAKINFNRPEPELFLPLAAVAMEKYHTQNGIYAKKWSQLDIQFVNGSYRVTDTEIAPPSSAGNLWKPKKSNYTYRITTANEKAFLIEAINEEGKSEYQGTQAAEFVKNKAEPIGN